MAKRKIDPELDAIVHDNAELFECWSRPRDPERVGRIAEKLARAWAMAPDLRLGQLVVNLTGTADPFYVEDDNMEKRLDDFIATGQFRQAGEKS